MTMEGSDYGTGTRARASYFNHGGLSALLHGSCLLFSQNSKENEKTTTNTFI